MSAPKHGLKLGHYTLISVVGEGGVGQVWRASTETGVPVAVKFLKGTPTAKLDRLLAREIGHTAMLAHPHVTDILGQGVWNGKRYVVLEWMQGGTLAERMAWLSIDEIFDVGRAILAALAHAHGQGLLHLDIKPQNVLCATVLPDWRVVDFGIAQVLGEARSAGRIAGTPAYMAPEQARGAALSPQTDLYALGVVMYELIHGVVPYLGTSESMMEAHKRGARRSWDPLFDVPDGLQAWVESLLAIDPDQRPRFAATALAALDRISGRPPAPEFEPYTLMGVRSPLIHARESSVALETLASAPFLSGRDEIEAEFWRLFGQLDSGPVVVWLDGPPRVGCSRIGEWFGQAVVELGKANTVTVGADLCLMAERLDPCFPTVLVCDRPVNRAELAAVQSSGAPVFLVVSDGPPPPGTHHTVAVPPLTDRRIRRVLVGLFSFHEATIARLFPIVCGSLGTLYDLLCYARDHGQLDDLAFTTRIDGPLEWPAEWTRDALERFEVVVGAAGRSERQQLEILRAGPARFRIADLRSICMVRRVPDPDPVVARLCAEGLLWRHEDHLWWSSPLVNHELRSRSSTELQGLWGDIEAVRGSPIEAARLWTAAGDPGHGLSLLVKRMHDLSRRGLDVSLVRCEQALGSLLSPDSPAELRARSLVARLRREFDAKEKTIEEIRLILSRHEELLRQVTPIDSGLAMLEVELCVRESLQDALDVLYRALNQPWSDPSHYSETVGCVGAILTARGEDSVDRLLQWRAQLDPELTGPLQCLDRRIAVALLATGRATEAAELLSVYSAETDPELYPSTLNLYGEALRLSGQPEQAQEVYLASARGFLYAGQWGWGAAMVNLGAALIASGDYADALHILTGLGRRGAVAQHLVLDTCRVALIASAYAGAAEWSAAVDALDGYEAAAARHDAVDPEQRIALEHTLDACRRLGGPVTLSRRVEALLGCVAPAQSPRGEGA